MQYAGRLQYFYLQWTQITDDPTLRSWIKGYKIPFTSTPIQFDSPCSMPKSEQEHYEYIKTIKNLIDINAISQCYHEEGEFISSVFLVPKPNGDKRFILNLKLLNKFIKTNHFKMEDYRTAIKLITKKCYMASVDLKDAYFFINVAKCHRKYLRFNYNGTLFEFNCLPFGLCTAPYVFTKILKPVMEHLRSRNMISVIYLDDIFCIGKQFDDCYVNVKHTCAFLEKLGFIINKDKSCLIPSTKCKFLGFVFDSQKMIMELPSDKKDKIKRNVQLCLNIRKCKLREFARTIGLLVSACPAIQYSWMRTKLFEQCKFNALLNNGSYNQTVLLPNFIREDLRWWLNNVDFGYSNIKTNKYIKEIFSDASSTGWGAYCDGNESYGYWKENEMKLHINQLELKAAFFALKVFASDCFDCELLLRIDNVTAISCINRMGSVQYPHLNDESRHIWKWCERRRIVILASYINTKDNQEADKLSRTKFQDTEWELGNYAYEEIKHKLGSPNIDLFASRCNSKCNTFVTWKNDPDAWAIDAFTISWKDLDFYAFPPFSMILKTIQKIISDKAEGIVVIPYWPTQAWFPLFNKICQSEIIYFPPDRNLLKSPYRSIHSLHRTLTLAAARLSGRLY